MTATVAPPPPARLFGREVEYKWIVAAVFVSAVFLDVLDVTIVNVALPKLGRDFDSDAVEWIVLGYTLSLAVWIPASGWLGDRIGTRKVFLGALTIFVTCSGLCGAAQSIEQLIAFRVLQGVGGGMLTPVGIAMLFRAFPPAERARASTLVMIPTMLAPALGPVLGGLIVTHIGWRWIFYVNLPFGRARPAVRLPVPPGAQGALRWSLRPARFHAVGRRSRAVGLCAERRAPGRVDLVRRSSASAIVGAVCVVGLVVVELRIDKPMLDLRLLSDRMFRGTNLVSLFSTASFIGLIFLLPLYLQNLRGMSALDSGLTTFPQAIGVLISSQIAGRLYARIGPRRLISGGLAWATLSILAFVLLGLDTNLWWIRLLIMVRGLGMGFAFVPIQASSYARIRPADNGRASSIFSTQRQVAASLGIALLATVLAGFTPVGRDAIDPQRALDGFHVTFVVTAALAAVAALLAWFLIHDEDAAIRARGVSVHPRARGARRRPTPGGRPGSPVAKGPNRCTPTASRRSG